MGHIAKHCDIDATVHMVYDGKKGDIIYQYVTFLNICHEQFRKHGRTQTAILEAIRICVDENILKEYLLSREKEVVDIMMMLYNREYIYDSMLKEAREEGAEANAKRTACKLYDLGFQLSRFPR